MERGDGALRQILKKTHFSPNDILKLARDVVDGGCALEEAGLVHRDGKPENLVKVSDQDGNYTWKKVDFGLASKEGSPLKNEGTTTYRSPESYGGTNPEDYHTSSKQDVFSDGLIIAETLLTLLPDDPERPTTIIHANNAPPQTSLDSDVLHAKRCSPETLMIRVATKYEELFYTPAVTALQDVKRQFPESAPLVDLAIRMIDKNPENRPRFSECRRFLERIS